METIMKKNKRPQALAFDLVRFVLALMGLSITLFALGS